MRRELTLLAALLALPAQAEPLFQPVAIPDHVYSGGWEHFVGGGLAVFDCSGDGLPELYAAGGENPGTLLRNTSGRSPFAKTRPTHWPCSVSPARTRWTSTATASSI